MLIWLAAVGCSLLLAVAALLVVLDADPDNPAVSVVLDAARALDLGVFSPDEGVVSFRSGDAATKNALANWGLGAIAYLVVGGVVARVIRP